VSREQARKLDAFNTDERQNAKVKSSTSGPKAVAGADGVECTICLDALSL
jgi:hypothetical protein